MTTKPRKCCIGAAWVSIVVFSMVSLLAWFPHTDEHVEDSILVSEAANVLPSVKYMIISVERSGSTYVAELLKHEPECNGMGEIFTSANFANKILRRRHRKEWDLFSDRMDALYNGTLDPLDNGYRVRGFKLLYHQWLGARHANPLAAKLLTSYINRNQIRVILLTRRNVIAQYLSYVDFQKGVKSPANNGSINDGVTVDLEEFEEYFNSTVEAWKTHIDLLGSVMSPYMLLNYEELLQYPHSEFSRLFRFLDLNAKSIDVLKTFSDNAPQSVASRTHSGCSQRVLNYEALKAKFQYRYPPMFHLCSREL